MGSKETKIAEIVEAFAERYSLTEKAREELTKFLEEMWSDGFDAVSTDY